MAHQYMPKIFHDPHKNPPATLPTYLMYGPLSCEACNKNWSNNNKKLSKKESSCHKSYKHNEFERRAADNYLVY